MTTTFETAKTGDKVWSIREGWGEIHDANESGAYPISVYYPFYGSKTYTKMGLEYVDDIHQTLFWGEVEIEAPQKPLPELELELLELKKDKARLDWLADAINKGTLRDAIDEAMKL